MPPMKMTFASGMYDRTVPLAIGEVQPEGVNLAFSDFHHARDVFDRQIANKKLDACELSSSEYITR